MRIKFGGSIPVSSQIETNTMDLGKTGPSTAVKTPKPVISKPDPGAVAANLRTHASYRKELGILEKSLKAGLLDKTPSSVVGKVEAIKTPEAEAISKMRSAFKSQFQELAADEQKFHTVMQQIYGSTYSREAGESFRQRALAGDYRWLPEVKFVSGGSVQHTNGVYDEGPPARLYLNDRLLKDPAEAARAFIRGVGYHLDHLTDVANPEETKITVGNITLLQIVPDKEAVGNEGELFRAALAGEPTNWGDRSKENRIPLIINDRGGLYEVV